MSRRGLVRALPLIVGCLILAPAMLGAEVSGQVSPARPEDAPMRKQDSRPIVLLGASYAKGWSLPVIAGRAVVNRGVAGEQSWEMLGRFDRDVTALNPSAVILWGYLNDIFRSSREQMDTTTARTRDSFDQMISRARTAGIEVILATEVTVGAKAEWSETIASWIGWVRGKQSYQDYINGRVTELNSWLRQRAAQHGLLLLDLQPILSDASGQRRKDFAAEDGSHITPAGYAALTTHAVPRLEQHFREAASANPSR
jgi:lysophospholipase L1-like esterase